MKRLFLLLALVACLAQGATAQTSPTAYHITISNVREAAGVVRGTITTNIPLPVDVMAAVSLHGQRPNDTYIGNDATIHVTNSSQEFEVSTRRGGGVYSVDRPQPGLPRGQYDVEVTFYPRWGAEHGPPAARQIHREITASVQIALTGNGQSSAGADARNRAQLWLMNNIEYGHRFDILELQRHLGPGNAFRITGDRLNPNVVVGYYFPNADVTVFMSNQLNEVLSWRIGRQTAP